MRSREFLLCSAALALLAGAGFLVLGGEALADVDPPAGMVTTTPTTGPGDQPASDLGAQPDVATGTLPAAAAVATAPPAARVDTHGWTKGVVKGDIQLAVSVLDRIQSITVEIVEARNPIAADGRVQLPTRLITPVARGRGTPTFEIHDVPFSEYPYVVSVRSPGLNGSRCTVTIDARTPLVDDLVLAITPGTPFTILVRDQDSAPFPGIDLAVQPVGEPAGRPAHKGTTDNFGSLVLEDVLAGDYELFASQAGLPLGSPKTLTVQPGGRTQVQGQSHTLTIERGVPVQVTVHDRAGYPYVDAKVTATATDRIKLTVRETVTNQVGIAAFSHLQPGTWQITVTKDRFHLWDKQVTVKPNQDPIYLDALLIPVQR